MKKSVHFDDEITSPTIKKLLAELEEAVKDLPSGEKIDFYFSSVGGECSNADVLTHWLNLHTDKIVLHGVGRICSCAVDVLLDYKGEKKLISNTVMLVVHLTTLTINYNGTASDKTLIASTDLVNKALLKKLEAIGMTQKDIARVRRGEDVYLTHKEIQHLKL